MTCQDLKFRIILKTNQRVEYIVGKHSRMQYNDNKKDICFLEVLKELEKRGGRYMEEKTKESYPDIVPIHPELSIEELEKQIKEELEEAKQMTEWPDL